MNQEFLYIIAIIALGYFLKRIHVLQEKDGEVIATLIFKLTLPALVLVTFDSVKIETSLIMIPILVIIYGIVISVIGLILFKDEERELKGSFLMLASGFNVGLFAFPLVYVIWGMTGLTYFSMYDVGASFTTFGIAYILGSYFSKEGLILKPIEILKKLGKSVPLMTYLFATTLNFAQISLPDGVISVADTISQANIPLSLLLLGLYMNFKFDRKLLKPVVKFLTYRYGFGLLLGLALFFLLPYDEMFRYTIVIGFLLPAATAVVAFAVEFKYSSTAIRLIATISNISILIGIIILYLFANFII
ncbi:AEC family transporter [Oceanobacillus salinisoli]|uniref:AEC family transporter n=1 Tax=Oceanobacillus salinisoli TaxID=2678611 RepID=UPI0012E1FDEB|nr:AEC family transporter [Oceanobacillus salinisoli]